ncbi:hypothetical protein [Saccharibacillus sp. JS10]|uniref:hypothetical protein n=1 Tax=Saccharibacillus sp. JS10 TaxID=2950552 RepID=UPI00210AE77D|nr:hypothetical protein [Saccharibacillus sp. JS10]MCQ4086445.1 hypothetical protein [Saccharibacillus sp. JS10]
MQNETIDQYRQELQRIAWRASYQERRRYRNEKIGFDEAMQIQANLSFYEPIRSDLNEYIEMIPFDKGKQVIESLFAKGSTEAEIAKSMKISQQGVSKWKRKSLQHLRQTMNS